MNMKTILTRTMQCIVVFIVSLGLVSVTSAQNLQNVQIGLGGGGYLPTGDADDVLDLGVAFHGTLLFGLDEMMQIEGGIGYWWLQFDEEFEDAADALGIDLDGSIIPITGGIRYQMAPQLHLDAGGGFYRVELEAENLGLDESETDFGVYGGAGYQMGPLDLVVRAHYPDFDDFYFTATVNYLFSIR
ncbi:outer membrane beta-barrel protein [candidate division KSB3 bacterium]|uniref:Outer membrane beta-barrel protein n=1 Tax=candidate division KSB3 bacterium TaxID=2044937 RepID=A0A9D5JV65_9BACT|nr:outer membrane beta-barrel protein [candidate division KSB3 bacterium]MBD3324266.1 outer membrane beta-barrel protein [candidate division KSB3 bacterium]